MESSAFDPGGIARGAEPHAAAQASRPPQALASTGPTGPRAQALTPRTACYDESVTAIPPVFVLDYSDHSPARETPEQRLETWSVLVNEAD